MPKTSVPPKASDPKRSAPRRMHLLARLEPEQSDRDQNHAKQPQPLMHPQNPTHNARAIARSHCAVHGHCPARVVQSAAPPLELETRAGAQHCAKPTPPKAPRPSWGCPRHDRAKLAREGATHSVGKKDPHETSLHAPSWPNHAMSPQSPAHQMAPVGWSPRAQFHFPARHATTWPAGPKACRRSHPKTKYHRLPA